MNQKPKTKNLGPEFATDGGKEDASIHEPILDNPVADKFYQDAAIRRAVARGMNLDLAHQLYGNKA